VSDQRNCECGEKSSCVLPNCNRFPSSPIPPGVETAREPRSLAERVGLPAPPMGVRISPTPTKKPTRKS
jgi:hypothetical protein